MSENTIKRYSLEDVRSLKSETDWTRLKNEGDSKEDQEFDVDWSSAHIAEPLAKQAISLRLDQDILDFFKSQGRGYQTRMNAVLRAYMNAQTKDQA